jgi:hypothetical protein
MKIYVKNELVLGFEPMTIDIDDFTEFNNVILPTEKEKKYIKLMFNGVNYYEGATPEEIAEQENQQKQELKRQAHEELLKTDWYVVRFVERGIEIPKEILEQRELIRNSI